MRSAGSSTALPRGRPSSLSCARMVSSISTQTCAQRRFGVCACSQRDRADFAELAGGWRAAGGAAPGRWEAYVGLVGCVVCVASRALSVVRPPSGLVLTLDSLPIGTLTCEALLKFPVVVLPEPLRLVSELLPIAFTSPWRERDGSKTHITAID